MSFPNIASRCCRLIGETPLSAEIDARRDQLDAADEFGMADARAAGLHQQTAILAVIMIIRSAQSARFLQDHLPGSRVPGHLR